MKKINILTTERSKIYSEIFPKKENNQILFKNKINKNQIKNIQELVKNLILKSLKKYYKKNFSSSKNYLKKYEKYIFNLPNITPNGSFNCTPEISYEFSKLHKLFLNTLKQLGILKYIKNATSLVLRVRKGENNYKINRRKYSTSKIHSDAWNGQFCDSIIMLMVDGDIKNNTVEFYSPINPKKQILRKIENFEKGNKMYDGLIFLEKASKGKIYIFDQLCLHKTFIDTKKPRISIDFGVTFKKNKKIKLFYKNNSKRYQYYSLNEWKKLNYLNISKFKYSFKKLEKKFF